MPTLVSNRRKFIFIHVPKTGGTSVTAALEPYENYYLPKKILRWAIYRSLGRQGAPKLVDSLTYRHASALEMMKAVPDFAGYFSFGFVRNPWQILVSAYNYTRQAPMHPLYKELQGVDFPAYARKYPGQVQQHLHLCDPTGRILVNFVGRFENLQQDFQTICSKIGLESELPHKFPGEVETDSTNYRDYYDAETRDLVAQTHERDIEIFGYSF